MPNFLEKRLRANVPNGVDADRYVYGAMNNLGAMHGNKETAKGREMEKKHEAKMMKPPFHQTTIMHHGDGSHTVEHMPHMKSGGKSGAFMERAEPTTYSATNHNMLMSKLTQHLGPAKPAHAMEEEGGAEPVGAPEEEEGA